MEIFEKVFDEITHFKGRIDANVTADTSKLIRMPDSIHGGSGFAAKRLASPDALAAFEPMRHAPIFGNAGSAPLRVKATEAIPALNIRDFSFGPIPAGEVRELPEACAIYLICKKAAVLA